MSIFSSSLSLIKIPPLAETPFRGWEREALSAAIGCHPDRVDGTGLAGLFLHPTDFARLDGADTPFRHTQHPGDAKDATGGRLKAYADERRAISAYRTALFGSIPPGVLAGVPGFDHGPLGHRAIEIPALLEHLRRIYGAPTLERCQDAMAALDEAQGSRSFEELVGDHSGHHAVANSCGQALSDLQKIRSFLAALSPSVRDTAQRSYQQYAQGRSDVAAHRFDPLVATLRTALRAAADTSVEARAGDANPVALAASVRPVASGSTDTVASALRELTTRVDRLATQVQRGGSRPSSEATPARDIPRPGDRYCWTHGVGTHASQECRNPATGHQKGATLRDRKGGSSRGRR